MRRHAEIIQRQPDTGRESATVRYRGSTFIITGRWVEEELTGGHLDDWIIRLGGDGAAEAFGPEIETALVREAEKQIARRRSASGEQ